MFLVYQLTISEDTNPPIQSEKKQRAVPPADESIMNSSTNKTNNTAINFTFNISLENG
jgi:hypothetical protein